MVPTINHRPRFAPHGPRLVLVTNGAAAIARRLVENHGTAAGTDRRMQSLDAVVNARQMVSLVARGTVPRLVNRAAVGIVPGIVVKHVLGAIVRLMVAHDRPGAIVHRMLGNVCGPCRDEQRAKSRIDGVY